MKTKGILLMAFLLVLVDGFGQEADKRFGFEFNTGASVATGKLGGAELKPGMGFEGIFHYRFFNQFGVYAGWGWNRFASDDSFAGDEADFEETGYIFGLQFQQLIGDSNLSYYVRGGGLYNHIEIEDTDGEIVDDSGHGLGWQIAAGLDISLNSIWSLTPGIKFNSLSRDTEYGSTSRNLDLNYIALRIGILKKF